MKSRFWRCALLCAALCAASAAASAQRMPERRLVRKGNRQFGREQYDKSMESYRRALESAPASFEAAYDLANAMFRAERYDAAEQALKGLAADTTASDIDRSEVFYNLGNAQFAQQKLQDALASYRAAMRFNPDDQEAKYNYAYTKHLLQEQQQQQQQQQQQGGGGSQDENDRQQEDKDKQSGQEGQNGDNGQNGQENDQPDGENGQQGRNGDDRGQEERRDGSATPQSGISEQEREAMLDAIQAQEDKTQDKLKEKTGVLVRGSKNW